MAGPLEGFRVIDLTNMVSGPLGTMILADQGADVIKVEAPKGGDHTRQVATRRNGFSASFLNNNRNKRSIALDLKTPAGLEAVKQLVRDADVFAQNFRPGVIERLGLGYEALREINPRLVYASISGFGFDGPFAQKPVFDPLIQSLSGLTTVQAGSDEERPKLVRTILPDKLTGFTLAQAVCAALLARSRTGEGQHIQLSMLDTVLAFLWGSDMGGHTFVGDEMEKEVAQSWIDLIYETRDGFISVAVMRHKEWVALARAAERPEWIERLEAAGVPCAPVLTRREAIRHPQVAANGIVVEHDHPQAGRLRQARNPAVFSATPAAQRSGAPALGAHTRAVLAEAGFSAGEIDAMLAGGAAFESATADEDPGEDAA
ncbi:CaiB/BaiF CoA-transferase family protein [Pelagibius sp.]|uniref:CaiB/BaiF CoA transferase family protein n=1 Tax=Pelagibius sp. TaxID=1931238 RepID=UPI002638D966|nr:CoA transferase [Pelagibius sp.]